MEVSRSTTVEELKQNVPGIEDIMEKYMGMRIPPVALNMVRKMTLTDTGKRAKWPEEKTDAFIAECNEAMKSMPTS